MSNKRCPWGLHVMNCNHNAELFAGLKHPKRKAAPLPKKVHAHHARNVAARLKNNATKKAAMAVAS